MTRIPRNDAEANVIAYYRLEGPLYRTLVRYTNATAKGMLVMAGHILEAAGYTGANPDILLRPANYEAIRQIEELAHRLPPDKGKALMVRLQGQMATGSLTVRRAMNDVIRYGRFTESLAIYDQSLSALRNTAKVGMYRGEFMFQKSVGFMWKMQTPGISKVDSLVKGHWARADVNEFLRPLSDIVMDEVKQSLVLGEHPSKLSERMQRIRHINGVRADRAARTITTAVANDAHMESYRRNGVDRYRYVATFDERTCPVCGSMDGRTFDLGERSMGTNYPPLHPNCRCTTVASLSKELTDRLFKDMAVRKKDGTVERMDATMTYKEWASKNLD